jgi:ubiquinone/menaquinone biosynthesis C-methylase UbiE
MNALQRYEQWHQAVHGAENPGDLKLEQWHRDALSLAPPLASLRVLEVGCGAGDFAVYLARADAQVWAVDFSSVAIGLARARAQRQGASVDFEIADAGALPFPDASFDLVFSCECLEHVPDPPLALGEMYRVLRPGGRLVLTTENYSNATLLQWAACWARRQPFNSGAGVQPIEHFFLYWRVSEMMRRAGFRMGRMLGAHHVFLLLPRLHPHTFIKERFASRTLGRLFRPLARHVTFEAVKPAKN